MNRNYLLFLLSFLFVSCTTYNDNEDSVEEVILDSPKDQYYIRYSAEYCSFHTHYIQYRNANGELISQTINSSDEVFFEVGPVSPIFQAYIEGNECIYSDSSINIYVRKNNQDYIKVASVSVTSRNPNGSAYLNYNLREYD